MNSLESRRQFIGNGIVAGAGALGVAIISGKRGVADDERRTEPGSGIKRVILESADRIYTSRGKELQYNSFTDIDVWRGKYYVVFRQAVKHHPSRSRLVLLESTDLKKWDEKVVLDRPELDDRDPKLLSTPDRLILYTTPFPHDTEVLYTEDGTHWSEPADAYSDDVGDQCWRPKAWMGSYYMACDYDNDRVDLLKSDDGLSWRYASTIMRGSKYAPTETAITFLKDGRCLAVTRGNTNSTCDPVFSIANPPYTSWSYGHGDKHFSGPAVERIGDSVIVVSRTVIGPEKGQWDFPRDPEIPDDDGQRTAVHRFDVETMSLGPPILLPTETSGDSSYPGILPIGEGRALISWHYGNRHWGTPGPNDIWLAQIRIVEP